MLNSHVCRITTKSNVSLKGLWFGPKRPKQTIVFVHGLGSSAFSMLHVVEKLVDIKTAVLTFNNRGHDVISRFSRKGKKSVLAGAAHEKFTDCVDDINGAIRFAKKQGAKDIYLMGHSTGCQKSVYWAAKGGKGVKGIILLAPVSDYAAGLKKYGKRKMERAVRVARALVKEGKKHVLLSPDVWPETLDAPRFLSLYTPNGTEEIFSYSQPKKYPKLLKQVRQSLLVLWASKDECCDRNPLEVQAWFSKHMRSKTSKVYSVPNANHGFKKHEREVSRIIAAWIG